MVVTESEDYADRIAAITGGRGARITFDPVGGEFLSAAAAPGGIIIEYGILAGDDGRFPVEYAIGKGLTIRGYAVSEIVTDPRGPRARRPVRAGPRRRGTVPAPGCRRLPARADP